MPRSKRKHSKSWKKSRRRRKALREQGDTMGVNGDKATRHRRAERAKR